jgi:hypothetical protein
MKCAAIRGIRAWIRVPLDDSESMEKCPPTSLNLFVDKNDGLDGSALPLISRIIQ